jgi:hypothetical protein
MRYIVVQNMPTYYLLKILTLEVKVLFDSFWSMHNPSFLNYEYACNGFLYKATVSLFLLSHTKHNVLYVIRLHAKAPALWQEFIQIHSCLLEAYCRRRMLRNTRNETFLPCI